MLLPQAPGQHSKPCTAVQHELAVLHAGEKTTHLPASSDNAVKPLQGIYALVLCRDKCLLVCAGMQAILVNM